MILTIAINENPSDQAMASARVLVRVDADGVLIAKDNIGLSDQLKARVLSDVMYLMSKRPSLMDIEA